MLIYLDLLDEEENFPCIVDFLLVEFWFCVFAFCWAVTTTAPKPKPKNHEYFNILSEKDKYLCVCGLSTITTWNVPCLKHVHRHLPHGGVVE